MRLGWAHRDATTRRWNTTALQTLGYTIEESDEDNSDDAGATLRERQVPEQQQDEQKEDEDEMEGDDGDEKKAEDAEATKQPRHEE